MIFAVVVTYNPDLERLKSNIESLGIQNPLDGIIVVDNGSKNVDKIESALSKTKVEIIKLGRNQGIARALNVGIQKASDTGADWVLTCDQDSILPANLMQSFSKYLQSEGVAILCPKIYDENAEIYVKPVSESSPFVCVEKCITSGSLTNVACWKNVNGFDEFLFIDGVDFDFCERLREKKFKICCVNDVVLRHTIGNMHVKKLGPFKILVLNHGAFRKYYILRNRIYCDFKMRGFISVKSCFAVVKQLLLILLFEKGKKEKLVSAAKGVKDGFVFGFKVKRSCHE